MLVLGESTSVVRYRESSPHCERGETSIEKKSSRVSLVSCHPRDRRGTNIASDPFRFIAQEPGGMLLCRQALSLTINVLEEVLLES